MTWGIDRFWWFLGWQHGSAGIPEESVTCDYAESYHDAYRIAFRRRMQGAVGA